MKLQLGQLSCHPNVRAGAGGPSRDPRGHTGSHTARDGVQAPAAQLPPRSQPSSVSVLTRAEGLPVSSPAWGWCPLQVAGTVGTVSGVLLSAVVAWSH